MDILAWIIIGLAVVVAMLVGACKIAEIVKMSREERAETVKTYLKGLIALAEKELGSDTGKEKLKMVEEMFQEKAPIIYKILFSYCGIESLDTLIEEALAELKEHFGSTEIAKE